MAGFDAVDWAIFAVVSFVAVVVLVRLMRGRREQLLNQLRGDLERERHRKLLDEKRQKQAAKNAERKAS